MSRELTEEELKYASPEDIEFFNDAIKGLPTREGFKGDFMDKDNIEIPYGSGPHILRHFKEMIGFFGKSYELRVLEIGFNFGHGAAMLLKLGCNVHSIDISEKLETRYAWLFLHYRYGGHRFKYSHRENMAKPYGYYHVAFIDGAHDEDSIFEDIALCQYMKIPYLLFDDWYPRYGETQKAVAQFPELELVKDMNNLRLYKVNYELGKENG